MPVAAAAATAPVPAQRLHQRRHSASSRPEQLSVAAPRFVGLQVLGGDERPCRRTMPTHAAVRLAPVVPSPA